MQLICISRTKKGVDSCLWSYIFYDFLPSGSNLGVEISVFTLKSRDFFVRSCRQEAASVRSSSS